MRCVIVGGCCGGADDVEDASVADFVRGCDHLEGARSVVQEGLLEIKSQS